MSDARPEFWIVRWLDCDWFDPDDLMVEVENQGGPVYYVVTKSVGYEVRSEPGAAPDRGGMS